MNDICYIPKDCYVFDVKIRVGDTDELHTVGYRLPSVIKEFWFIKETPRDVVKYAMTDDINKMIDALYDELEKENK